MTRKAIRPYAYCIQKALDILDAHPDAADDDFDLVNRIQGAIYFQGRDAAGLEVPSPPEVQWNLIMKVLHRTRLMPEIRAAFDEFFDEPAMQWPVQPGDAVSLLIHLNPPSAVHGGVYRVNHLEERAARPRKLPPRSPNHTGQMIAAHDVVWIETMEGLQEIRADQVAPLLNEDPSGYVHRAYTLAWKLDAEIPDSPLFKELREVVTGLRAELRAAVGATAHQMTDPAIYGAEQ